MFLLLSVSPALALAPTTTSSLKTITLCSSATFGCPNYAANPIVAQPSGEILPPPPELQAYLASLYGGEIGALATTVNLGGNTIDGYVFVARNEDGTLDPATWLGFGSTTEDWDQDSVADLSAGSLTWESQGQLQASLAFMSGTDATFEPSRELGLTVALTAAGSASAPFTAWSLETLAIFDMEGNNLYQSEASLASVGVELNDFFYASTVSMSGRTTSANEMALWTVDGDALLATSKSQLSSQGSAADLSLSQSTAGDAYVESWTADANVSSFRRSLTVTDGASRSVATYLDTGSRRRVVSTVGQVVEGVAAVGRVVGAAEDLTFTSYAPPLVSAELWDRVAGALSD